MGKITSFFWLYIRSESNLMLSLRLVEWFYPKKLSKTKKIIFDLCRGCGPTSLTAEAEDFMAFKNTSQFCLRWWILSFSMSFPHIFESAFTSLCQFWPKFLVRWMLQRTLAPSFFLSSFFFFLPFLYLAYLHMIDQFKMPLLLLLLLLLLLWCARVCADVGGCARVCASERRHAQVCVGGCGWV